MPPFLIDREGEEGAAEPSGDRALDLCGLQKLPALSAPSAAAASATGGICALALGAAAEEEEEDESSPALGETTASVRLAGERLAEARTGTAEMDAAVIPAWEDVEEEGTAGLTNSEESMVAWKRGKPG